MREAAEEPVVAFRVWYARSLRGLLAPAASVRKHPVSAAATGSSASPAASRRGLYSVAMGISWSPGVNEAFCPYAKSKDAPPLPLARKLHLPGEQAPVGRCGCGIYSYGSLETTKRYREDCYQRLSLLLVLGAVRIWGKTLIARATDYSGKLVNPGLRYRSQFAEVLAVVREAEEGQQVAAQMGVPAVAEEYLEAYARELGQQLRSHWPPLSRSGTAGSGA